MMVYAELEVFMRLSSVHAAPDKDGDPMYAIHINFPTTTLEAQHWRDELIPNLRQQYNV